MTFDEHDVERYAEALGRPNTPVGTPQEAARSVLQALGNDGRLLPPGGTTRVEYGLEQDNQVVKGILMIGVGERAEKWATHERRATVWPDEGPNDYWARYVTAWVKREGS